MISKSEKIRRLESRFDDLINYDSDDPADAINPIEYMTPEGDNCLHIAVMRGDIESVRDLLDLGLDINSQGDMGNTSLHYAIKFSQDEIYRLLISKGADRNIRNEFEQVPQYRDLNS